MSYYIRFTAGVRDKGVLINPEDLEQYVTDIEQDYYYSPYFYDEEALEYFNSNGKSIKGFKGKAWTNTLFWDLDCKEDFQRTRTAAIAICDKLFELGFVQKNIEIYFSGNKGLHVLAHTDTDFDPKETKKICYNLAVDAEIATDVFDSAVYNVTRIFRLEGTKHPVSGLHKVPLSYEDLKEASEDDIRSGARKSKINVHETFNGPGEPLKDLYNLNKIVQLVSPALESDSTVCDFKSCPPGKRKCIFSLEQGYFGPGERENATIRLAAYYRAQNLSRDETLANIISSLERREKIFDNAEPWNESDIHRNLDQVFSDGWNGGSYSCKDDIFLQQHCDQGEGCHIYGVKQARFRVMNIESLIADYIEQADEALEQYPETGLKWLDTNVRFRPNNYSIINGSVGSGKTSLAVQFMENLNKQKMPHIIFSLDMASTSLLEKIAVRETGMTPEQVERAFNVHTRDKVIMDEIANVLKTKYPYTYFDFTSSCTVSHIEKTVEYYAHREQDPIKFRLVFIDYAGRIMADKETDFANATAIAKSANDLCKKTKTHIMFISQISREHGDHTTPVYTSRASMNSSEWEANATVVVNVWRPFGSGKHSDQDHYMSTYIAKNRGGKMGEWVFRWNGKSGRIENMSDREIRKYMDECETFSTEGVAKPYLSIDNDGNMTAEQAKSHPNMNTKEVKDSGKDRVHNSKRFKDSSKRFGSH